MTVWSGGILSFQLRRTLGGTLGTATSRPEELGGVRTGSSMCVGREELGAVPPPPPVAPADECSG